MFYSSRGTGNTAEHHLTLTIIQCYADFGATPPTLLMFYYFDVFIYETGWTKDQKQTHNTHAHTLPF